MYCALDKVDLSARTTDGTIVAVQTDHRERSEIEAEPELSALFAMARVLNARAQLADDGHPNTSVRYALSADPPQLLRAALAAAGGTLERIDLGRTLEPLGPASSQAIGELADQCFGALAHRVAVRVGARDIAIALHMLEAQTHAAPPKRDDADAYWRRVLELAALAGELLRARFTGSWVHTERALVPFGFQLADGRTLVFPTNRAQRIVDDGQDESLLDLLAAADEALQRPLDARTGRLMPSLRARGDVELDEVVWRPVLADEVGAELPVVVCGIDGEHTFGMIRRAALERDPTSPDPDVALTQAIANLAGEATERRAIDLDGLVVVVVSGSFYAAEKLLDRQLLCELHGELSASELVAATPTRGVLLVAARRDPARVARFAAIVRSQFEDGGGRAIAPTVWIVNDGRVVARLP